MHFFLLYISFIRVLMKFFYLLKCRSLIQKSTLFLFIHNWSRWCLIVLIALFCCFLKYCCWWAYWISWILCTLYIIRNFDVVIRNITYELIDWFIIWILCPLYIIRNFDVVIKWFISWILCTLYMYELNYIMYVITLYIKKIIIKWI